MNQVVPGHSLVREGAPHRDDGRPNNEAYSHGTGGTGCGKCTCGALSPVLNSGTKRKAWHRQHKADVRAQEQPHNDLETAAALGVGYYLRHDFMSQRDLATADGWDAAINAVRRVIAEARETLAATAAPNADPEEAKP